MSVGLALLYLMLGLFFVVKGADILISSAISIGKKNNISEFFIGVVIIGFGTSLPELLVSIDAILNEFPDLSVGNVVGSNIANLLLVFGFIGFFSELTIKKISKFDISSHFFVHIFFLIIVMFLTFNLSFGLLFLFLFILYLYFSFKSSLLENFEEIQIEDSLLAKLSFKKPFVYGLPIVILSIIVTLLGAELTVDSAIYLSNQLGISDSFIGLTVIAIGTSLPEIATCIAAAKKNKINLIMGNIIGSNMYNLLLILGLASLFDSFFFTKEELIFEIIFLTTIVSLFSIFLLKKSTITLITAIASIAIYGLYLANLFWKNFS